VYPDPEVEKLITTSFTPARFHVKEQPEAFQRFGAEWTPTIMMSTVDGKERHRIEGFLPKEDFLPQLRLGLAHVARESGDFKTAESRYRDLANDRSPDIAAEALYWAGVSKYKGTNDPAALGETARNIRERFPDSTWMKKASVWEQ
jgi:thioredoxin-related protein